MIAVDTKGTGSAPFSSVTTAELAAAHDSLKTRSGPGAAFTDWLTWPRDYPKDEFARIKSCAERIRRDSKVLVVVGIGGSYLGARAVIDALHGASYNLKTKDTPDIFFAGNNISGRYLEDILALIGDRDFSVNVISKSGTTTEPAVAFRVFKALLEKKYGKQGARTRIYASTDKARGALKTLADEEGYETFVIPDGIGGRYSVFTPVGLLPIAAAGLDIDGFMRGAADMMEALSTPGEQNPAWQYAAARQAQYRDGKAIEVLGVYEPDLRFLCEWWKQLFGESEGKQHQGLFPASLELTADLHSMGQYMQDGVRHLLETILVVEQTPASVTVPSDPHCADNLEFLAGRPLSELNDKAFLGTYLAHVDGGVPNIVLRLPELNACHLGGLLYFFMLSCALSGTVQGVNPFDQPGVEDYKVNMFALLGKPGYEDRQKELTARL